MPLIFGDHMVLQQETKLPVWGFADSGEKVSVSFKGQTGSAVADADGKWRVELPPITPSSEPGILTIMGKNTITFQDVLVGDVWVASGQSNMEIGVNNIPSVAGEVAKSDDPLLRLYFAPHVSSLTPLEDFLPEPLSYSGQTPASVAALKIPHDPYRAKWVLCTPENLRKINGQGFATVAYLFAREIRTHTGRPIGIIQAGWGGTRAETWISLSGLKKEPPFKSYIEFHQKQMEMFPSLEATFAQRKSDYDAAYAKWMEEVGRPWNKAQEEWRKAQAAGEPASPEPRPSSPPPQNVEHPDVGSYTPSTLFNAMISPLTRMAIKGVIWYQGEFNSGFDSGIQYRTLFPRLVSDWREKWGRGDFPFLFVQLPNYGPVDTQPSVEGEGWRWIREAQLKALSLPQTAMAITIDVGDPDDLHPPDKLDVALRLSLTARQLVYGENIVASGPLYDTMKIEGDKVRLTFTNRGSGLVMGVSPYHPAGKEPPAAPTELKGFGLAGDDHTFYWAKAMIDGDTVVVSSDKVPAPIAVRYNFSDSPQGNLYNKEGLPASPFRTDNWDDKDK